MDLADEPGARSVAMRIGLVEAKYQGEARFEDLDTENCRMRLVA